jgi:type I restriction enzyme S subunit
MSTATKKLKTIAKVYNGATPKSDNPDFWDGDIMWATPVDLGAHKYLQSTKRNITLTGYSSCNTKLVDPGNIIISNRAPIGLVAINKMPVCTNQGCKALELDKSRIDASYLYYVLKASESKLNSLGTGTTFMEISSDALKNFNIPYIELKEQKSVAAYIDSKTQTLDKMLAAKNHTHTQLQELRTSIIASTVLGRGGAAMSLRQTNIPWIGSIPAHWQVEKVKGVADIVLGKMLQSTEKEGYAYKKYLRAQNIRWENVDVSDVNEMWFSPRELSTYRLQKDDILVSEGGEVGRAAIWKNELDECYIQNSVNRLRVNRKKILPEYLLYVLESYGQAKVFEGTVNRVSIAHLTREKLKEYYIPLPPLAEQHQIVEDIQNRLHKIDTTSRQLERSIAYLEEYRSSLISNVVGGKVEI